MTKASGLSLSWKDLPVDSPLMAVRVSLVKEIRKTHPKPK
jgi:hypothetical protein